MLQLQLVLLFVLARHGDRNHTPNRMSDRLLKCQVLLYIHI